jgi:hypothetical protein
MGNSASDRFKNRANRPVVVRSDSLLPTDEQPKEAEKIITPPAPAEGIASLEAELDTLPKVSAYYQVRLAEQTRDEIKAFAQQHDITPELLIEGLWEVVKAKPEQTATAVEIARTRGDLRKRAAKLKGAITRLQNLTS